MNDLEQIDGDGKDLSASLKDFLVLFEDGFILFFEVLLGLGLGGVSFEDLFEFGIGRGFVGLGWRSHLSEKGNYSFFLVFFEGVESLIEVPVAEVLFDVVLNFLAVELSLHLSIQNIIFKLWSS